MNLKNFAGIIISFLFLSSVIWPGPYNDRAKAKNQIFETYTDESGQTAQREVKRDGYGNAAGTSYDLAVDGAFEGQTVAVLHFYTGDGFDFSLPKKALKQKGFAVYRYINAPPKPEKLRKDLKEACQLWII